MKGEKIQDKKENNHELKRKRNRMPFLKHKKAEKKFDFFKIRFTRIIRTLTSVSYTVHLK